MLRPLCMEDIHSYFFKLFKEHFEEYLSKYTKKKMFFRWKKTVCYPTYWMKFSQDSSPVRLWKTHFFTNSPGWNLEEIHPRGFYNLGTKFVWHSLSNTVNVILYLQKRRWRGASFWTPVLAVVRTARSRTWARPGSGGRVRRRPGSVKVRLSVN